MMTDFDLARRILLNRAASDRGDDTSQEENLFDRSQIEDHVRQLTNAGLIDQRERVTAAGRDFIDAVCCDENWRRVEVFLPLARGWSFSLIRDLAVRTKAVPNGCKKSGCTATRR